MATMTETIKRITVQASAVGIDQTTSALLNLAKAQNENVVVQERVSKSTLSVESSLKKLQMSVDAEYRSEQKLESVHKTLTAARNEGLISIQRENELLTLAKVKYTEAGKAVELMGESMRVGKELALGLVAGLGTGAVFVGLAELPAKILETVHEAAGLTHVAETIGITTKSLQELQYTGAQFHISTETMDSALEKFSKNLGVAATGSGELAKILKLNHVVISGDLTKDFLNYANLVAGATSAEQRNLLVTTAFGKSAEEMGLFFDHGAEGVKRLADEADNLGGVLSGAALASAAKLDAEFVKMQAQVGVTFKDFAISVAPDLIDTLHAIAEAVRGVNAVMDQFKPIDERVLITPLQNNLNVLENQIATMKQDIADHQAITSAMPDSVLGISNFVKTGNQAVVDQSKQQLELLYKQADQLLNRIDQLQGMPTDPNKAQGGVAHGSIDFQSGGFFTATKTPDVGAEAAAKAAADAAAAQAKAYTAVTNSLHQQLAALHETDLQKQIDLELSQAKVSASSREGRAITDLTTDLYNQKKALEAANQAEGFFAQTAETAFEGLISGGQSLTDELGNVLQALEAAVLQAALLGSGPLAGLLGTGPTTAGGTGGILGDIFSALIPHANGGVYSSASLSAYSNSIVSKPTPFRFASGAGLMGEAGPEAIMPLKRGADGRLGVAAANSNEGLTINVQIIRQPGSGEDRATVTRNGNKLDVKAFIKDTAAESAAQPGGTVNRAIRLGLGGKQTLTGRGQ